jgi:alanyl-tRNA synthetase
MKTAEIRDRFVQHFLSRGHELVPGVPLPYDDPNLLLVNSGMVQFVPFYSGDVDPPWLRATSVQKCVRTVDIEEVGRTTRHGTFFQMCGNFSFGDYFKEDAIAWAWELSTGSVGNGGYGLDGDRIWPTVFETDDEAFEIWHDKIGIPAERIQRRGMADNLWSMGIPGPCGPSSELFYDRGPDYGEEGGPAVDEDRFIEFWNLVFMTSVRGRGTSKTDYEIIGTLPRRNIDTGMGLERVATLLQGVNNLYEIDETRPVIDRVAELSGKVYGVQSGPSAASSHPDDIRFRIVADHVRTALMLIGDGVSPSNEGRGYVLRRIMRRAIRSARLLGAKGELFPELLPVSRDAMAASFPGLAADFDRISMVAYGEEEAFLRTLSSGTAMLDVAVQKAKASSSALLGSEAFTLHDTYGFPIDLTIEIAAEQGLTVDEDGFRRLMAEQRQRAKSDARAKKGEAESTEAYLQLRELGATEFTGYESLDTDAQVLGVVDRGAAVTEANQGDVVDVVLDRTSFYAESGGQIADEGFIQLADARLRVLDVQKMFKDLIVHRVEVESGTVRINEPATTKVDPEWRLSARQAHSGTHVVHAALREVLGPSAVQSGSYNKPGYLRLDFVWSRALDDQVRADIEAVSNGVLRRDLPVSVRYMALDEARAQGALALFGETYNPGQVRVVEIGGPWSRELCGGTHVQHASQIGSIAVLGDSSVGAGLRRIEAYVGMEAFRYLATERALVSNLSSMLKVPSVELPDRVSALVARLKEAEQELERNRDAALADRATSLVTGAAQTIAGTRVVTHLLPGTTPAKDVRAMAQRVVGSIADAPGLALLVGRDQDRVGYVAAVNGRGRAAGLAANAMLQAFSEVVGGRGGGSAEVAQGGGGNPGSVERGFDAVRQLLVAGEHR